MGAYLLEISMSAINGFGPLIIVIPPGWKRSQGTWPDQQPTNFAVVLSQEEWRQWRELEKQLR
jgi:hypothetical protein